MKVSDGSGGTEETMGLRLPPAGGSSTRKGSQMSMNPTTAERDKSLMKNKSNERCDTKPLSDSGSNQKTLEKQ